MDTITHGIAGALIAKAFFAERRSPPGNEPEGAGGIADAAPARGWSESGRVAVLASTLGAILPDGDVFFGALARNDLAILEWHRGVTHSLMCLPIWAVALAALTRWYTKRRGWTAPSWIVLAVIYAVTLSSHILLDLITSFGTMIWCPLRYTRPAWDLAFILDFTLLGTLLLPQLAAWVYRDRERSFLRAAGLWSACTLGVLLVYWSARALRFPFSPVALLVIAAVLAALFFLPAAGDRGYRWRRATWCRAGVCAFAAYLGFCAAAHQVALRRVRQFAAERNLRAGEIGALPLPPSLAHWDGLIRTLDGIYEGRFNIFSADPPVLQFLADSPLNGYIAAARRLPRVQTYLWFARFPLYRYSETLADAGAAAAKSPGFVAEKSPRAAVSKLPRALAGGSADAGGGLHIVEIRDLRFFSRGRRPAPFTFRVTFDDSGRVLEQGLIREVW